MNPATVHACRALSISFACLALHAAAAEPARQEQDLKTAKQLWDASAEILQPYKPVAARGMAGPRDDDRPRVFVVDYLGSGDAALREAATEIVAKAPKDIRSSAFEKYLDARHPLNVRVVALARTLRGTWGWEEEGPDPETYERRQRLCGDVFAEIAKQPAPPPHFFAVARQIESGSPAFKSIRPPDYKPLLRMFLALLPRDDWDYVEAVQAFPDDLVVEELKAWYPKERNPYARLRLVEGYARRASASYPKWLKVKPFLELAANDKDPEIAAAARKGVSAYRHVPGS